MILTKLDAAIGRVVSSGNCSGCGMCSRLDDGLQMVQDDQGFCRPFRARPGQQVETALEDFRRGCPGVIVRAASPAGSTRHPMLGPVHQAWAAWATDPEIRFRGSSGGALTALSVWLMETGQAHDTIGARVDSAEPRRTVSVRILTRDEAVAAAGSRYAPTSNAALGPRADGAFVGKPCEVSAVRATSGVGAHPLLLSFFCAGTPSQKATESLVEQLGIATDTPLRDLWYRGRGWPGEFTVVPDHGDTVTTTYADSWGRSLGPAIQWRCKICPDGVGEHADIAAADFWKVDAQGYPLFNETDGMSALVARTLRGRDIVERALEAGVLDGYSITPDEIAAVQPSQVKRRTMLAARLMGTVAARQIIPSFPSFGLGRLAASDARAAVSVARATFLRVRAGRRSDGASRKSRQK